MRNIVSVIDQITAAIPSPVPVELADNIGTLQAELRILRRTAEYQASELPVTDLWSRLSTALYRYMPNAEAYPFAAQISQIVTTP